MTDTFRALCAELVEKIGYTWGDIPEDVLDLMDRTRAAIAQTEPAKPDPTPKALTVADCNQMSKHVENFMSEVSPDRIVLDGEFSRTDLVEIANTVSPQNRNSSTTDTPMTTDYRALCAELLNTWDNPEFDLSDVDQAMDRARAALAQPESIRDRIAQADAAIEASMERIRAIAAPARAALAQPEPPQPEPTVWSAINAMADRIASLETAVSGALSALAQPEPPAVGEVAELVKLLRAEADDASEQWLSTDNLRRAADILERLAQPEPVARELPVSAVCANFQALIELLASRKAGDQELMIYRWPIDGSWSIELGNPSSCVQLGEVGGEITAGGSSLASAVASLATELNATDIFENLTQPEPVVLPPRVGHVLRLAEIIREVDGNHDKGAAALAEAILDHPDSRWQPHEAQSEPVGPEPTRRQIMMLADGFATDPGGRVLLVCEVLRRLSRPTPILRYVAPD